MHIPNVTDEDNSQYTCVAINNGGRVISNAELYVLEKGIIKFFLIRKLSKQKQIDMTPICLFFVVESLIE